jgi:hypothetical protein
MRGTWSGIRHWMATMAGVAVAAAALPVGAASAPVPVTTTPAAGWHANQDDALLFDVRIAQYRLGDGVRGYATPTGTCVDFADIIITLDLPVRLDKKLRRATGWMFNEGRTITLDREANTVQIMNNKTGLAPNAIQDTPEGWCVQLGALQNWLGIKIIEDSHNALLVLHSDTKLPVQSALERKAKAASIRPDVSFDLKTLPQAKVSYAGFKPPAIDVVASASTLRDKRSGNMVNASYEIFASGEVGEVAYDARLASDSRGIPASLRVRAYRTDPDAHLLGRLHATHVEVGDVTGVSTPLVAQTSFGRGLMITNRPVERPDSFSRTNFIGELPTGWDAELYRNGQLMAFAGASVDGRYEFRDVALLYGQNRFEVVLYGPQGQIRRQQQIIAVGLNSIPPRQTYYWAGIDEDGHDLVSLAHPVLPGQGGWRGSLGLERGLTRSTSVSFMFHSLNMGALVGRRNYFEESLRQALGPALFEFSAAQSLPGGGLALRAQMLAQFGNTYMSFESINARGGFQSDRVLPNVTGIQTLAIDQTIKLGQTYFPVHVDTKYTTSLSGASTLDTTGRLSANFGRWLMTGEVDWIKSHASIGLAPPDQINAGLLANVRIGRVRLRGEARFELAPVSRLSTVSLVGEWQSGRDDQSGNHWRAELGYDQILSRARIGVGFVRQFKRVALTTSGEVASDGSVAAGLSLAFSLGGNGHGGMRMTAEKQAAHGAVLVRVFRDLNHNGVHDPGEPWEKGVQITTGRVPVTDATNAQGEVIVDGLQPYIPVLIGIDGSTLADPLMQPEGPGLVVTPRPGITQEIELPVATSGEVDGTLTRAGGGHIEGVDVELIDPAGHVAARTRTEYDGYLLFENVPYGRYALRIGKLSAQALRVELDLSKTADVTERTPSVHLGTIVVGH